MGRRGRPRKYPLPPSTTVTNAASNRQLRKLAEDIVDIETIDIEKSDSEDKIAFDEHTFGGLLTKEQAERDKNTPSIGDKRLFERALAACETLCSLNEIEASAATGKTRKKGRELVIADSHGEYPIFKWLHFGPSVVLNPWYGSPFPAEYFEGPEPGHLYMCPVCLTYMRAEFTFKRHLKKCNGWPPGDEIYRKGELGIFEVNGRSRKEYCQRLCLLGKMFLDHKDVYYDTEPFLFYLLVKWTPVPTDVMSDRLVKPRHELYWWDFVGYFSKEKNSPTDYNLSCIMTLPHHQRHGYGSFMIDFSYLLSKREGKFGTPEKPLTDLGLAGYVKYWSNVVLDVLETTQQRVNERISIDQICNATGMIANDVLATLEYLGAIGWVDQRGERKQIVICPPSGLFEKHRERQKVRSWPRADIEHLKWVPYTCSR